MATKVYKYRLYPTKKQQSLLSEQLAAHCRLYNAALAERKSTYETTSKGLTYNKQAAGILKDARKSDKVLADSCYDTLQQTLMRLDRSYKNFFRRVKAGEAPGFPRFKSTDRFNTVGFNRYGAGCKVRRTHLYIRGVGEIKVKWHRDLPCIPKTLSLTRRCNKWYVNFSCEVPAEPLPKTSNGVIGIDMGLRNFATFSDGTVIKNPHHMKKSMEHLAFVYRRLDRRTKGSKRRAKARDLLAKAYEKISNQRHDFLHKLANDVVQKYNGIAVEALNIRKMISSNPSKHISRSIADASWGTFLGILRSKAENAGRGFEEVNPAGTSQLCSNCGNLVPKCISENLHICPRCHLKIDRDLNAAANIKSRARTGPSASSTFQLPRSPRL